jgi:hypothetical protein
MAKGYWARGYWQTCRDCKSGPKAKFCCPLCGWVIKAPWGAIPMCTNHRVELVCMGDKWRPLKKKHRLANARAAQERFDYLRSLAEVWKS